MIFTVPALLQWIALGEQVLQTGQGALHAVTAAVAAHGISADTAQLDAVILDAGRRKAIAEAEAASPHSDTGSDVPGGGAS